MQLRGYFLRSTAASHEDRVEVLPPVESSKRDLTVSEMRREFFAAHGVPEKFQGDTLGDLLPDTKHGGTRRGPNIPLVVVRLEGRR